MHEGVRAGKRMPPAWLLLLLPVRAAGGGAGLLQVAPDESDYELLRELIDWVQSQGGYISKKQAIRREDPSDPRSLRGVYATEPIRKGELLHAVPAEAILHGDGESWCSTVRELLKEKELGNESAFAPYVRFLMAQSAGQLPSAWSDSGKALLSVVTKNNTFPDAQVSAMTHLWELECQGDSTPRVLHAAMIVVQRGEDDLLVPWYDMHSHRNGRWTNANRESTEGEVSQLVASRDIEAGEQIYLSYNQCPVDCRLRLFEYGTAELFKDYGFIEPMPQRWFIPDLELVFDLDHKRDGSGDLEVIWQFDWRPSELTAPKVSVLREELQRLRGLQADWSALVAGVIAAEERACRQYLAALATALAHAVDSAQGALALAVDSAAGAELPAPAGGRGAEEGEL